MKLLQNGSRVSGKVVEMKTNVGGNGHDKEKKKEKKLIIKKKN